jgi:leucyl aminopeptidase (aminopeptidase T)
MPTATVFGPFSPELSPGAQNAIEVCLAIQPHERVALIADEVSREVAASLDAAIEAIGASTDRILIEQIASRPLPDAPLEILAALDGADAGILCVHPQQGELRARMAIVATVERRQMRYAHMVGVTPKIMMQGMRADYRLVDQLSIKLCERMRTAAALRVDTDHGTSLTATFDPALHWVKTSGIISPRYWSNLPAGEVFTTPASVDGVFVCNGTAGDYFGPKYGDLSRTPMTLEIARGRLVSVHCERRELEREFREYCRTDPYSNRVGELAFGTNLALSDMIGNLLQDEKVPGVHLAFGDPYGSQTGADWKSTTHVDVLTRDCNVWIDDEQVIQRGKYLLKTLGL